jgi:hypothetical protein
LFETLEELVREPIEIAALTAGDLHRVAQQSFDASRAVWGVVRGKA